MIGGLATVIALGFLLPGLLDHGIGADGEAMVHARADALRGAAHAGLVRAPWLPDWLRSAALAGLGRPEAIRAPGAVAAALLVGLTAGIGRWRGLGPGMALCAGGFALAFPLTQGQGRTALGDPVGEALGALAALAAAAAMRRGGAAAAGLWAAAAGLCGLASMCAGIVLGGALPAVAAALALPTGSGRGATWTRIGLGAGIAGLGIAAFALVSELGDGYIPVLGAARDLALAERPYSRGLADGLAELGYQVFPWLPLALVGALRPGPLGWPAMWLGAGLTITTIWSMVVGAGAQPLTVPAALCCAAGLRFLADPRASRPLRRLCLGLAVGGVLVLGKDARRTPGAIAAPLATGAGALDAAAIGAEALLPRLGHLALLTLAAAAIGGRRRRPIGWLAPATAAGALAVQAAAIGHGLVPATAAHTSLRRPFDRLAGWQAAGALPEGLAIARMSEPTLAIYGPPPRARQVVGTRAEASAWLARPTPAAALIRQGDLAALAAEARAAGRPLFVLDRGHREAALVSNTLPEGAGDQSPLRGIVGDAPPALTNPTLVQFEEMLEVIGWEIDGALIRGGEATLTVGLRVLRPPPAGAQLYVRLQRGRLSRIGGQPAPLAEGLYPPNLWRAGDFITHRQRIKVPLLEVVSGGHDLVIGVRASPSKNLEIRAPQGARGEYGVEVLDKQRSFAAVGRVQVW